MPPRLVHRAPGVVLREKEEPSKPGARFPRPGVHRKTVADEPLREPGRGMPIAGHVVVRAGMRGEHVAARGDNAEDLAWLRDGVVREVDNECLATVNMRLRRHRQHKVLRAAHVRGAPVHAAGGSGAHPGVDRDRGELGIRKLHNPGRRRGHDGRGGHWGCLVLHVEHDLKKRGHVAADALGPPFRDGGDARWRCCAKGLVVGDGNFAVGLEAQPQRRACHVPPGVGTEGVRVVYPVPGHHDGDVAILLAVRPNRNVGREPAQLQHFASRQPKVGLELHDESRLSLCHVRGRTEVHVGESLLLNGANTASP
mmetsp:Transcript_46973/g.96050  ORF Transcript_46973/g.96050 Transcript_46973/m.96050 type:complete len:311 (-) Transcript_46973:3159-4091(-)